MPLTPPQPITVEDLDSLMEGLPDLSRGRGRIAAAGGEEVTLVEGWGPLTQEHVAAEREWREAGAPSIDQGVPSLKHIRASHHRLAQLLAVGTPQITAAALCNYSPIRVSILAGDPAFQELMAHYQGNVKESWADFVEASATLSVDMLQELQRRLDETPEGFTHTHLMEGIKLLADRSGHAPVSRNLNVNVNADLGDRLEAARRRLALANSDGT